MVYEEDKNFADSFNEEAIKIIDNLSEYIGIPKYEIKLATKELDVTKATDIILYFDIRDISFGLRTRRNISYRDLTIRTDSRKGGMTEKTKILDGYPKWYLYIWTNNIEIISWIFIDMNVVRRRKILEKKRKKIYNYDNNGKKDNTSFINISLSELGFKEYDKDNGCIVAFQSDEIIDMLIEEYIKKNKTNSKDPKMF